MLHLCTVLVFGGRPMSKEEKMASELTKDPIGCKRGYAAALS